VAGEFECSGLEGADGGQRLGLSESVHDKVQRYYCAMPDVRCFLNIGLLVVAALLFASFPLS
jgi:hypothetical protein